MGPRDNVLCNSYINIWGLTVYVTIYRYSPPRDVKICLEHFRGKNLREMSIAIVNIKLTKHSPPLLYLQSPITILLWWGFTEAPSRGQETLMLLSPGPWGDGLKSSYNCSPRELTKYFCIIFWYVLIIQYRYKIIQMLTFTLGLIAVPDLLTFMLVHVK